MEIHSRINSCFTIRYTDGLKNKELTFNPSADFYSGLISIFMKKIFILCFLCVILVVSAEVKLSAIFTNGMVLQQNTEVAVWGKSDPNKQVIISGSWNADKKRVKADENGRFIVKLKTTQAGGPYTLNFDDGQTKTISDVFLGEVFLCSGQSNMEIRVKDALQPEKELLDADFPTIHIFKIEKAESLTKVDDVKGSWTSVNPENVLSKGAIVFFLSRQLYKLLHVPIGVIHSSYGATPQEAWLAEPYIQEFDEARTFLEDARHNKVKEELQKRVPTVLYHAMIEPIIPFTINAVFWYQGEANSTKNETYSLLLSHLITSWRQSWDNSTLPFIITQLAGYGLSEKRDMPWVETQHIQFSMSKKFPNVATVMAYDCGDEKNIHPANKQEVARRMFLAAQKLIYNKNILIQGPEIVKIEPKEDCIILTYDNVGSGLLSGNGEKNIRCFSIAAGNKQYVEAQAEIISKNQVKVWSDHVKKPVQLMYASKSFNPVVNLYNSEKLPAVPFKSERDLK